jgi:hypothetical protein
MKLAVLVAIGLLATAASAGAAITPTRDHRQSRGRR